MATTTEIAAASRKPSGSARSNADTASGAAASAAEVFEGSSREAELQEQISQLQSDLKSITQTLSKLTNEKVEEAKDYAGAELRQLKVRGQHMLDEAHGQAEEYEQQLKDTIREKPITAVATALGIGFVLALLTRH